jgi:hypothetical protein
MPLSERPKKVKDHEFKEPIRQLRSTMELVAVKDKHTTAHSQARKNKSKH